MLLMPFGRDQADNAARVVARGAGLMLPADAGVGAIRAALQQLLADPSFAAAARALGAQVVAEAQASPLVPILETLAGTARSPGTLNAA